MTTSYLTNGIQKFGAIFLIFVGSLIGVKVCTYGWGQI